MRHRELQRRLRLIERLRGLVGRRVLDEDEFRSLHRGLVDALDGAKPISERQVRDLERLVIERDRGAVLGAQVDELRRAILSGRRVPWPTSARDAPSRATLVRPSGAKRRRSLALTLAALVTVGVGAVGVVMVSDDQVIIEAGGSPTTAVRGATADAGPTSASVRGWVVSAATTVAPRPTTSTAASPSVNKPIATTTTRLIPPPVTNVPAGVTTSPPATTPTSPPTTAPKPCPVGAATVRTLNIVKTKLPVTPGVPATEDRFAASVDVVFRNSSSTTARVRTVLVVASDYEGAAPAVLQIDVGAGGTRTTTKHFELYASQRAAISVGLQNTTIAYRCNGSFA